MCGRNIQKLASAIAGKLKNGKIKLSEYPQVKGQMLAAFFLEII